MTISELVLGHAPREQMAARIAELSLRPDAESLYFGCIERAGHYLWQRHGAAIVNAWGEPSGILSKTFGSIDGRLCWNSPKDPRNWERRDETEGLAFRTCRAGWTAVAFWDRSVDARGACNSAFFVRGELTFAQAVRVARHQWPVIWARFTFDVIEVDAQGRRT